MKLAWGKILQKSHKGRGKKEGSTNGGGAGKRWKGWEGMAVKLRWGWVG